MTVYDTEIELPEGLRNALSPFNTSQLRRRVYIFLDGQLLPRPGSDYTLSDTTLIIPHQIRTLEIVTVSIPSTDERWYYSHADGWGRL